MFREMSVCVQLTFSVVQFFFLVLVFSFFVVLISSFFFNCCAGCGYIVGFTKVHAMYHIHPT
jgi:hypothetical protein